MNLIRLPLAGLIIFNFKSKSAEEKEMTNRYSHLKVAVYGDHMVDYTIHCNPKRISQEAPVLILKQDYVEYQLGGASNVALNLKQLGAKVMVSGMIGRDRFGKALQLLFERKGISTQGLVSGPRPTTLKTRIVAQGRQLIRYDNEIKDSICSSSEKTAITKIKKFNPDIIVVVDYDKGNVTQGIMRKLQKLHKPIYINGKPEHVTYYHKVHCLVCNNYEYTHSCQQLETKDLRQTLGCETIIHTLGAKGLNIVTKEGTEYVAPYIVQEIDPTGASDTIIAVVALEEQVTDVAKAAKLANKAASIIVTHPGTQAITYKDIEKEVIQLFSTTKE